MKKNIFNQEAFTKKKGDIIFFIAGIVLCVVTLYTCVQSISFLATAVNGALDENQTETESVRFNIQGLKNLGMLKPEDEERLKKELNEPIPSVMSIPSPTPSPTPSVQQQSPAVSPDVPTPTPQSDENILF